MNPLGMKWEHCPFPYNGFVMSWTRTLHLAPSENSILIYIWSMLGLESLDLGLIEYLVFGFTLSAIDHVMILAIFNQYKVDPKLYTIILGASLLNDAISIVMYE
jgi:Kef-type K+ transport system membrane component KefB